MDVPAHIQKELLDALASTGSAGITITDLEKKVSLERHTLSKYLSILRGKGVLYYKSVGKAKVWFIDNVPIKSVLAVPYEKKTYSERVLSGLIEGIPLGLVIIDAKCNIQFANYVITEKYGEVNGKSFPLSIMGKDNIEECLNKLSLVSSILNPEFQTTDKFNNILKCKVAKLDNPDNTISFIVIIDDITEKVYSKRRLEEYKLAIDSSDAQIVAIDKNANYLFVNEEFLRNHNKSYDEVVGKNARDILGGDLFAKLEPFIEKAIGGETLFYTVENNLNRQVMVQYYPLKEDGKIKGVVASIKDIHDEFLMEKELKATKTSFKKVFDSANIGIALIDPKNRTFREVNPFLEGMIGDKNLIGKPILDYLVIYNQKMLDCISHCNGCDNLSGEISLKTADGKVLLTDVSFSCVKSEDRNFIIATIKDVTNQVRCEKGFKLCTIIQHAPDTILLVNKEGRIIFANHDLDGSDASPVIGKNLVDYIADSQLPQEARVKIENALTKGIESKMTQEIINRQGKKVTINAKIGPVPGKGGEGLVFINSSLVDKNP